MTRNRIVLAVIGGWLLLGVVWGAQMAIGSILRGGDPIPVVRAIRNTVLQTLPWIPVTLAAIAVAVRFPLFRPAWRRHLLIHLAAALLLAFTANVLIVFEYWVMTGTFGNLITLARQGALWATINLHVAVLIYAAVVAITHGALYYRHTRDRMLQLAKVEGQLARARLEALNAQIRPHFLFNTLHTIGQLWRSGRSDDADAVLDSLGHLYSRVHTFTPDTEVTFGEELELVRDYLAIEQTRFRDRLRTTIEATEEAQRCMVPPLILQPLVENAIRHGVSAVSSAGRVSVSAVLAGDHLRITVQDDGPGVRSRSPQAGSGTGLRNTRERLLQLYGPRATLGIEDAPGGGTRVTVNIPAMHPRSSEVEGVPLSTLPTTSMQGT